MWLKPHVFYITCRDEKEGKEEFMTCRDFSSYFFFFFNFPLLSNQTITTCHTHTHISTQEASLSSPFTTLDFVIKFHVHFPFISQHFHFMSTEKTTFDTFDSEISRDSRFFLARIFFSSYTWLTFYLILLAI